MTLLGPVKVAVEESEEEHVSIKPKKDKPYLVEQKAHSYRYRAEKRRFEESELKWIKIGRFPSLSSATGAARDYIMKQENNMYTLSGWMGGEVRISGPDGSETTMYSKLVPQRGHWVFNGEKVPAMYVMRNKHEYDWKQCEFRGAVWLIPFTRLGYFKGRYHEEEIEESEGGVQKARAK